jgi:transcriptional regulator with XRE-family HTH domain
VRNPQEAVHGLLPHRLELALGQQLQLVLDGAGNHAPLEPFRDRRSRLAELGGKVAPVTGLKVGQNLVWGHHRQSLRNSDTKNKGSGKLNYGRPLETAPTIRGMGVGKRIRALRLAMGLKQGELARQAGIGQGTLSDLERGDSALPRGDSLIRLASILKVSQDWLITGMGSPVQAVQPQLDESELLQIYKDLSETNKLALLATARALLGAQPMPTTASPHKRTVKQK